jgi:alpha-L-glutamate ligase-like protein
MFRLDRTLFWAWPWELRRRGVLGINERNLRLVFRLNPRARYVNVDDKSVTKTICEAHGIPVPQTYGVISRFGDIRRFSEIAGNRRQFVVKPACGSAGRGILVVTEHDGKSFTVVDGRRLGLVDVRYHLSTTLSGLYSLGGRPDKAIVEERILKHPAMEDLAIGGTPDIRIVVHRCRPVMAMLRLPTEESGGRANLHQGAVGVGIDISSGQTTKATYYNRAVDRHPDSGARLEGREIPHWTDALLAAADLSRALELGYIGVDIVLDAGRGPLVLEANARPGLAIQIANADGLLRRLTGGEVASAAGSPARASPAGAS